MTSAAPKHSQRKPPRKRGANDRPMGRPATEREPKLRHPGVAVLAPQPKARKPHWRLKWCVDSHSTPQRFEYESLPYAKTRRDCLPRAADKSRELRERPVARPHDQTLMHATEQFIAGGKIKVSKGGSRDYAPHSRRAIRDGVAQLDRFALSLGASWKDHAGQRSAVVSELWRVISGRTVLARWVEHERKRRKSDGSAYSDGTFELAKKWPHAVLSRLTRPDGTPLFDALFISATLPVHHAAARNPARTIEPSDIATLLDGALALDSAQWLPSADIALVLLSCMRRFEAVYLRVRHVRIDAPVKRHATRLGTWIALPSKLDDNPDRNHAKNGKARSVGFAQRDPGKALVGLSPLGAELVAALAVGRQPDEWLIGSSYQRLATGMAQVCAAAGLDHLSPQRLRTTCANHVVEMIGKDRATQRNGHTEKVYDDSYMDNEYELDLWERPPSLESSLGIEAQLRAIIDRVRQHARSWGHGERPLPAKSARYGAATLTSNGAPSTR